MGVHIIEFDEKSLIWDFGSEPRYVYGRNNGYSQAVDPFPAYAHDLASVIPTVELCSELWPLTISLYYHVSRFEDVNRINGWSSTETIWGRGDAPNDHIGHIFLSGKRIPPHPGVTRYVTAHEYGHQVQWDIERRRGMQVDALLEEYAELRQMTGKPSHGTGGVWHEAVGEVFACDFRVFITSTEVEYWPHAGIEEPTWRVSEAHAWWTQQLEEAREAVA